MNQPPSSALIARGLNVSFLLVGVALVLAGLAATVVGLFSKFGLRLGMIPIPLSIVGPLLAVVGVAGVFMSFRQHKCVPCNQSLDHAQAYFPISAVNQVQQAIAAGNAALLAAVPMGSPANEHVQVSLDFCAKCRAVAQVDVDAFGASRAALVKAGLLTGPRVDVLASLLRSREEAHEATYEAQA